MNMKIIIAAFAIILAIGSVAVRVVLDTPQAFAETQSADETKSMNQAHEAVGAMYMLGDLAIENVTARATVPGAKVGGGYLTITNNGQETDTLITGATDTIIIENGWQGSVNCYGHLILEHMVEGKSTSAASTECNPVTLEIFNSQFMSIAEQMGIVLRNTSQSVNVKERLDFSCAIFDAAGNLVANAPHVPVHLGSMDASVKVIIESGVAIDAGDAFVANNPHNGGSHLPDITVVSPVFDEAGDLVPRSASAGSRVAQGADDVADGDLCIVTWFREFFEFDAAFHLVADVDDRLARFDRENGAFDDGALVRGLQFEAFFEEGFEFLHGGFRHKCQSPVSISLADRLSPAVFTFTGLRGVSANDKRRGGSLRL